MLMALHRCVLCAVLFAAMGPVACRQIDGLDGMVFDLAVDGGPPDDDGTLDGGSGGGSTSYSGSDACATGLVICPSGCADLSSDPANCSHCGHACSSGASCKGGHCH